MTRLWVSIAALPAGGDHHLPIHYHGVSPGAAAQLDLPVGEPMPRGVIAIIEPDEPTSGCLLIRFSRDGEEVGDTWHESAEYAKQQAALEFGESLGVWHPIPPELTSDTFIREQLGV